MSRVLPATLITDVRLAADLLTRGELVAIPTETVYGLAGNALSEEAAAAIFSAKDRPSFDPLIIHQASAGRVFAHAREIPDRARLLADRFWPGPLTLVLPKADHVPDIVTAGLPTVAMRVPRHPLALRLLRSLAFPLAAPSANPFGFVSPTTAAHVLEQLGTRIAAVLDGGPCAVGLESTIVGFERGRAVVYRKGGLPVEVIEGALGEPVDLREHGSSKPTAPGMLSKHYSPGLPIRLFSGGLDATVAPPGAALVVFGRNGPKLRYDPENDQTVYDLSPEGDLTEAASGLFSLLRRLRGARHPEALIELVPERGLGRAINDRLRRAAAKE